MAAKAFRTNYRLLALFTAGLFVAFGFVRPRAGAVWKTDYSFWSTVGVLTSGHYSCPTTEVVSTILLLAALLLVPAVVIAWVLQACVVVVSTSFRHGKGKGTR